VKRKKICYYRHHQVDYYVVHLIDRWPVTTPYQLALPTNLDRGRLLHNKLLLSGGWIQTGSSLSHVVIRTNLLQKQRSLLLLLSRRRLVEVLLQSSLSLMRMTILYHQVSMKLPLSLLILLLQLSRQTILPP
jgi:hypothetical protein